MHHGVTRHAAFEIGQLIGGGQLTIQQQETHFEMGRFGGQLFDRIATIQKLALVAVDKGDRTFASGGRGEAGIIGEHIRIGVKFADIDHIGAHGGRVDRQIIGLAVKVQRRGSVGLGHHASPLYGGHPGGEAVPFRPGWRKSGCGIGNPGNRFFLAEDQHHVINTWRRRPPCQCRPQGRSQFAKSDSVFGSNFGEQRLK